jgi:hypothetical protein
MTQSRDLFLIALNISEKQPVNSERTASDNSERQLKKPAFLRSGSTELAVFQCVISE